MLGSEAAGPGLGSSFRIPFPVSSEKAPPGFFSFGGFKREVQRARREGFESRPDPSLALSEL